MQKALEPQLAAWRASGNLVFEFRHRVVHTGTDAEIAAQAAECALAQGRFWEYHATLLANQQGQFPKEKLKRLAADLKLDSAQFSQCLDSGKSAANVQQETAAAAARGIKVTPTFELNGRVIAAPANATLQQYVTQIVQTVQKEIDKK